MGSESLSCGLHLAVEQWTTQLEFRSTLTVGGKTLSSVVNRKGTRKVNITLLSHYSSLTILLTHVAPTCHPCQKCQSASRTRYPGHVAKAPYLGTEASRRRSHRGGEKKQEAAQGRAIKRVANTIISETEAEKNRLTRRQHPRPHSAPSQAWTSTTNGM